MRHDLNASRWAAIVGLCAAVAACGGGSTASDRAAPHAAGAETRSMQALAAQAWTQCATEGGTCNYSGSRPVRYGTAATYVTRLLTGPTPCNNAVFGDPVPNVAKTCWVGSTVRGDAPIPPPPPPPAPPPPPPGDTVGSDAEAARFLVQATYGPTIPEVARLRSLGYNAWLTEQFTQPPIDTHWGYVVRQGPVGCTICESTFINATMESFWKQAVEGRDQLRQRMVFALSELFVVSTVNSAVDGQKEAHAAYLDMLARNSFGNFRSLLEEVTRHPTMGHYLSYLRNEKEDPNSGRTPDENYAREVMQLFSIGLWELNLDGSRRRDAQGRDIPTYGLSDVMGMARVMTGLSWGGGAPTMDRWFGWMGGVPPWDAPMQFYNPYHSTGEKRFLGVTIPATTTANGDADLRIALDTLFNHPNVGPFLAKHLIKRFVTSNPSPAYVARVAQAFNGGNGRARGDLQATIRAVLMDPEARDAARIADPQWGKLREPIVRYGNFLRAFNVTAPSGAYRIWNLEDPIGSLGQNPLRAPSVFNWFRSDYAPPGEIANAGLTAPEFQITHETTLTGYNNFLDWTVERTTAPFSNGSPHFMRADYSAERALANQPDALLDRLNVLLMAGQMTAGTRAQVRSAMLATQNLDYRVYHAIRLLMASPEYIVQK